jgi:DNA polymerase III epsilon subunit-like protein
VKLFVFDTETGGLDPAEQSILTLGGVIFEDGEIRDEFDVKIAEPLMVVEQEAMAVNHINLGDLAATGVSPLLAVRSLEEFLRPHFRVGRTTLAGQNVAFDVGFLRRLYRLAAAEAATVPDAYHLAFKAWEKRMYRLYSHHTLDTQSSALLLELAGVDTFPNGRSLGALCEKYGVTNEGAHSALADARATAQVLGKMMESLHASTRQ